MSAAMGVLGLVFLIAGLLSPEPFNGLDLLGCLIGCGLVIRTIWLATEVDAAHGANHHATEREPELNGATHE